MDEEFKEANGNLIPGSSLASIANAMTNTFWSVSGTVECAFLSDYIGVHSVNCK